MNKSELRTHYKALRSALPVTEREADSLAIANQALSLAIWDYDYYHVFLPIERLMEVDTTFILHILQGKDKHVLLSKSDFQKGTLTNYLLTDTTKLNINKYGIPEPEGGIEIPIEKIDVVFIPLVAYDYLGNRVGYGKGFYDRFLAQCREDVVKIGLSYFEPESTKIPTEYTDIPLNYCITAKKIHIF